MGGLSIMNPLIYIVILNWNGRRDTLECLTSVAKIDYPRFAVLVVDNGSTDDSVALIRTQFPHIALMETGKNLGFAEGNNVGIQEALRQGADAVLLLNNDTLVDPQILSGFSKTMTEHPEAGIFGATIFLYDERDRLDHFGGNWNRRRAAFDFVGFRAKEHAKESLVLDYVCGAAILIRREVFAKIGLLEPRYFLIWEEADFCFSAKRAGFLSRTSPDAFLWHKVSASFTGKKPHTTYYWWRNRLLWIERNCSFKEKVPLSFILLREISHLLKLYLLKTLQIPLTAREKRQEKKAKILQYRAALCGVKDYLLRRFGKGPLWVTKSH
ncbi:MAG: glycosyltransferase family 2 protein [Chlamydiales bacterium]